MSKIPQTPHQEEWQQLTVICLGAFLFFNSFGSVNVALSTIQSHFGTAAGTLGTTIAVALIEANMSGKGIQDPVSFAAGQQFAFSVLLPLAAVALLISLGGRTKEKG